MAGYLSETKNYRTLTVSTLEAVKSTLADNIFKSDPLSAMLMAKGRMKTQAGGENVQETIEYDKNNTISPVAKGGSVSTTRNEKRTKARFDWVYYAGSVLDYYHEDKENAGAYQLRNVVQDEISNLEKSMKEVFGSEIFANGTTYGNDGMDGLQVAVPYTATWSSTQNYGQLNPTAGSQEYWRNQTETMASTSFAGNWDTYFLRLEDNMQINKGKLDLIVGPHAIVRYYKQECLGLKSIAYKSMLADLGFTVYEYNGKPIVADRNCPAQTLYFLDLDHLRIVYNPKAWFDRTDWKPDQNTLDYVLQVICAWTLTADSRRAHGIIANINTA